MPYYSGGSAEMRPLVKGWQARILAWGPVIRALWVVAPTVTWVVDYGRGRHNNYKIFRHVFWHLWERRNLYLTYPEKYGDANHYGPVFALVIAPYALLPDALGGLLWNLSMAGLLWLALRRLQLPPERLLVVMLACVVDLANANWSNQFNPAIPALVLLTLADVEEGRDFRAPLWALLGAFVKLYGVVGLVALLFARDRRAFLLGCLAWSALLLVLPMALSSPGHVLQSYRDWFHSLVEKNALNVSLGSQQDVSIMGAFRRIGGSAYPTAWFLAAGLPLALGPLLRRGQYRHHEFRLLLVASLLMFTVLFSTGSENATYVLLGVGAGLWLALRPEPFAPRHALLLGILLLAGLAPTDLLSVPVRLFVNRYALRAIPAAVVWLLLCRELLTRDFGRPLATAP